MTTPPPDPREALAEVLLRHGHVEWSEHDATVVADAILTSDALARLLADREAEAWSLGHAAGRDYQADGWNSDAHDPEEDNPFHAQEVRRG